MKKPLHLAFLILVLEVAVSGCTTRAFNSCPTLNEVLRLHDDLGERSDATIVGEVRSLDFLAPGDLKVKKDSLTTRSEVSLKQIIRNSAIKFPASFNVIDIMLDVPADFSATLPVIGRNYVFALNRVKGEGARYADFQLVSSAPCR